MGHRTSHGKELPVPAPAAKLGASLSNDFEYAGIFTGQSNSLPWGLPQEGYDFSLELQQQPPGLDLPTVTILENLDRAVGMVELLVVDSGGELITSVYDTSTWLRLGTQTAPEQGYAKVIRSQAGALTVRWLSLPASPNGSIDAGSFVVGAQYTILSVGTTDFTAIGASSNTVGVVFTATGAGTGSGLAVTSPPGYLVREDGKFYSYENVRVLTPYLPWQDTRPPIEGSPFTAWIPPFNSPYPTADALLSAGGKRLTLPNGTIGKVGPWTLPPLVTEFEDLGVYLPVTRREGADGYGISEIADATYDGTGTPIGHPLTAVAPAVPAVAFTVGQWYEILVVGTTDFTLIGAANNTVGTQFQATGVGSGSGTATAFETFSFANAIVGGADLTNAYLLIDWENGGESKRSWARVESNKSGSFATETASWLGDGNPGVATLKSAAVTFDETLNEAITAGALPEVGDRVFFEGVEPPATNGLGDTVTFNDSTDRVEGWMAHGMAEGQPVYFQTTTTLADPLSPNLIYYVRNPTLNDFQLSNGPNEAIIDLLDTGTGTHTGFTAAFADDRVYFVVETRSTDRFKIAESMDHPPISFDAVGGGGMTYRQTWVYTVWIPHWKDNPFTWLPGPEFAYPNEDHQLRNTFIHWRARGQYLWGYNNKAEPGSGTPLLEPFDGVADSRFGPLLPFAWRTGAALGKTLNMVMLGVGSTPLAATTAANSAAGNYTGQVGWWQYNRYGYALQLEDSTSFMAQRLKRLITFIAPNALVAEGNSKGLRYLMACHIQGEADGFTEAGREFYNSFITDYRQWLRDLVIDGGWSPFEGDAQMPFAQPVISNFYEDPEQSLLWADEFGEINNAIREMHTADEFSGYVLSDDLPKINTGHYSGGGMVVLGARLAVSIIDNLEHALSYGSSALVRANTRLLRIANLALVYIGQGANPITSLNDSSVEAQTVSLMLPEATQQVLAMRQWSFALRRESAARVKHNNPKWGYCYAVPGRAITPTEIIPPATQTPEGQASHVFVSVPDPLLQDEIDAQQIAVATQPYPFEMEGSPSGHRLLFTNVAEVAGDLSAPIPVPSNELFPDRLAKSPTIRYVDKLVDPDRYSPDFVQTLAWQLASMIAPALVKGEAGDSVAQMAMKRAAGHVRSAANQESASNEIPHPHIPPWIAGR